MQLPVHTQLDEDVPRRARTACGHLVEDLLPDAAVRQTGGILGHAAAVPGLDGEGVNIVGNLRLAQFVHVVADLVGNAPAEEHRVSAARGPALSQCACGAVADADMVPGGVHERSGEHAHIADVLTGLHGITVAGKRISRADNPLDLVGNEKCLLPGEDVLVHGLNLVIGTKPVQNLVCGQAQQDAGRGNLRGVEDVGLGIRPILCHVGLQRRHVGADGVTPGSFVHAVPAGELQDGDDGCFLVGEHMEFDLLRMLAGVGHVERAAPGIGQVPDLGDVDMVASVPQLNRGPSPDAGFSVVLRGDDGDCLTFRKLGVDRHRRFGLGGDAQRLEVACALTVCAVRSAAAALEIVLHEPQDGGIIC